MATESGKSRIVFALLAWFLGAFGAQYWYVGNSKAAIITIVATWLTCGLGGLISLIGAIHSLIMSDQDFDAKIVNTDKALPL